MDSALEDRRGLHEERDRVELAVVNEMLAKKNGHREKLDSEHRQKVLIDRYMKSSKTLHSTYDQQSVSSVREEPSSGTATFNSFYTALREIKDFYLRHSNDQVVTLANEFEEIEAARLFAIGIRTKPNPEDAPTRRDDDSGAEGDSDPDGPGGDRRAGEIQRLTRGLPSADLVEIVDAPVPAQVISKPEKQIEFTDEEGYGRYLDLTECHEAFLQVLKREETKPNYLTFLNRFDRFTDIEREYKLSAVYKSYVEGMLEYFRNYCKRAKPLTDYQDLENKAYESFVDQWKNKTFAGWFRDSDRALNDDTQMIDLETYRSSEELMELGLECLKKELQVRGLKCGGTLEDRAKRLWSIRGKSPIEIDESLRAAPIISKKGKKKSTIEPFAIASIEALLVMYADYFNDHRMATIENVQRKQSRTAEERNESDEDISDLDDDDSDQNDVRYNPKNLPLGWDGKPIPYWLYKLHGLNLTYTCEICGNATYKGPKTFQRHFAEWRHAHGMRCLGIPNTAHFANITKIQDAISLWDKLKSERQKDKFQPQVEEEFEDSQGNVVNKKTYEDLKRQGLL